MLTTKNEEVDKIGSSRWILWRLAIDKVKEKPIFGVGLENLGNYYYENGVGWTDRPHNIVIQTMVFTGIPGCILYFSALMFVFVYNFKYSWKNKKNNTYLIVFIGYLISALFGNSMFYTSPYFLIILGGLIVDFEE